MRSLPTAWSIADPHALPPGHPLLRSFDVLLDGGRVERVRAYDCAAGTVRVVDIGASIDAGACIEHELTGTVTLSPRSSEQD